MNTDLDAFEASVLRQARRKVILGLMGLAALLSVILPCLYFGIIMGTGSWDLEKRGKSTPLSTATG